MEMRIAFYDQICLKLKERQEV